MKRPNGRDELKACREIVATAAAYIESDWGEPLKDADIPDSIENERLFELVEYMAKKIKAVKP